MRRSDRLALIPIEPAQLAESPSVNILSRRNILQGALATALPLGIYGCSSADHAPGEEPLVVGGLPVTCNLTLPVACVGKSRAIEAGTSPNKFRFEYSK